jgi:replicative DNA helicase
MSENSETDHFNQELKEIEEREEREISGLPSGFSELDRLTGGWQDSDLIVIGSRPTMGKTSFLLSIAERIALDDERPRSVAIFSLEMSTDQLAGRMLTSRAKIDGQKRRTGDLDEEETERLQKAAETLSGAPIHIDDTAELEVEALLNECRRIDEDRGVDLVVVDYLQLLTASESNLPTSTSRAVVLSHIVSKLKALAMELDVPVIVASQLNREVENRGGDKRPQLIDLRGSGAIEEVADVIAFIYRAERYGITVDPQGDSTEGTAEIIIGKQRSGPIGVAEIAFLKQSARFEPLTPEHRTSEEASQGSSPSPGPPSGQDEGKNLSGDAPF